jgi:hypothetical protein
MSHLRYKLCKSKGTGDRFSESPTREAPASWQLAHRLAQCNHWFWRDLRSLNRFVALSRNLAGPARAWISEEDLIR